MVKRQSDPRAGWYLEGYIGDDRRIVRVPITRWPYTVGRGADASLRLPSQEVSTEHARLFIQDGQIWLEDTGSTNGTWVNRSPVDGRVLLNVGDILHFSTREFRLGRDKSTGSGGDPAERTVAFLIKDLDLPEKFPANIRGFRELLQKRRLAVYFQPIVLLDAALLRGLPATRYGRPAYPADLERTTAPFAYEALGRSEQAGLPSRPDQLFALAASIAAEDQLSRLMRECAASEARKLPGEPKVFVNTHPQETRTGELLGSILAIRERWPALQLVLEIHETWVTDVPHIREFAKDLDAMGVELAYDDFGAGQARLIELIEAPPAYLKFDRSLVHGLAEATGPKVQMVETLVKMVLEFGIAPLAEGLENPDDARLCLDMGFQYGQGYLFGRPARAETFHGLITDQDPGAH